LTEKSRAPGDSGGDRRQLIGLRPLLARLRPYRLPALGALLAMAVSAGMVLAFGQGLKYLIDEGFRTGDARLLDQAVLAVFASTVVLAASSYSRFFLVSWVGERVVADLRKQVFGHVLTLSPGFFEVTRTGDVISRLTTDTSVLQTVVGSSLPFAMRNAMTFLGGSVLLFATSPQLAAIAAIVVPLVVVPIILFGRRVRALSRAAQRRVAETAAEANESLYGIRTVQAFGHEPITGQRFGVQVELAFAAARKWIAARAGLTAFFILCVFASISLVLWVGGHDVLAGRMTAGQLSTFIFYSIIVAMAVAGMGEVLGDLQRAAGAMDRLSELLATRSMVEVPTQPLALPEPPTGAVSFQAVSFHYPTRPERQAIEGIDLQVRAGEKLALVGPSGAGKSTIFQLLLRFYDPQAGRILLDGVDITRADPEMVRRRIGLVPQEPTIFSSSAAENIRYGRPEASDTEVQAAAVAAHAAEFLDRLPEGFATPLGERGVRLSGGQRQRIAIARAVLRAPALLLLDEATSALDAESERVVQEALAQLMEGRTTIVIAHRLATVQICDRIVVMDHGRIVETGTHAELVRQEGLYARLAALQFNFGVEMESPLHASTGSAESL
jgi:ATP-binding cassette, subfamily B, bacterial